MLRVGELGVPGEPEEISAGAESGDGVPRHVVEHSFDDHEPASDESGGNPTAMCGVGGATECVGTSPGKAHRGVVIHDAGGATSAAALSPAPDAENQGSVVGEVIRDHGYSNARVSGGATVVGPPLGTLPFKTVAVPRAGSHNRDRCKPVGLGGDSEWQNCEWSLDRSGTCGPDKCSGVEGGLVGIEDVCQESDQLSCARARGQRYGGEPHQQDGRNTIMQAGWNNFGNMAILSRPANHGVGGVSAGETECGSRPAISVVTGVERLAVGKAGLCPVGEALGSFHMGLVCQPAECTASPLCELEARPGRGSSGCSTNKLDGGGVVCVPSILPVSQVSGEDPKGEGQGSSGGTSLEGAAMVSRPVLPAGRLSSIIASATKSVEVTGRGDAPIVGRRQSPASGLESFRQRARAEGISTQAAALLSKAWRPGTGKAYDSAWQRWSRWCLEQDIDPIQAPVARIVDFLSEMFHHGYQYSTLNGYRSAISAFHIKVNGEPVGQHELVISVF